MRIICFVLLCLHSIVLINGRMQCRDESGETVDWYIVYKFPRITNAKSPLDTGYKYAFLTSNDELSGWTLSKHPINDPEKSIFAKTLQSVYAPKRDSQTSFINYNDQPPYMDPPRSVAHAKGFVVADHTKGFWLIHTVPKFTFNQSTEEYEYPTSGGRYAQIALCISFKISQFDKIVEQFLYMRPYVYSSLISDHLTKSSHNIKALINKEWNRGNLSIHSIESVNGKEFLSFSKGPSDHVDLYSDIVAPELNTNLYVQTWRKNPGTPLPSECELKKTVENINEISLKFSNSEETGKIGYLDDHSKWAISKSLHLPYSCFGDLNRMKSQFKRGGGTTCIRALSVCQYLNEWVSNVEKCHH